MFDNCKAVFQGGGCKAVAYVGAYQEAYNRGVFFSELSGTSAGAIIAALIAAGATPEQLKNIVMDLDFNEFIQDFHKPSILIKLISYFLFPKDFRKYRKYISKKSIINEYGVFSMQKLKHFIDKNLKIITGRNNEITFNDLIPDLHIISADLNTNQVKIWSKILTPNESVSKAVCCSCAIPFLFKPIDNRYVDGGVLCNLPNFVFQEEPHYNKILSFRLLSQDDELMINSLKDFAKSLIKTIVDGSDNLHKLIGVDTYYMDINVGNISSIDFAKINNEKKEELIQKGQTAAKKFFDDEEVYRRNKITNQPKILKSLEQVYSLVSYLGNRNHKKIYIICKDTYWSWYLFPTLVKWINSQTEVKIFVNNSIIEHQEAEMSRRRMLIEMGCAVFENQHNNFDIEGFYFKDKYWRAITYKNTGIEPFYGKYYEDKLDISHVYYRIKDLEQLPEYNIPLSPNIKPIKIKKIKTAHIINALLKDPIYEHATMRFQDIEISKVLFMNPFIRSVKYKQIDQMFKIYKDENLPPFSPAALIFPLNNKESIIGPPVVEEKNGKFYVIEGNTRFLYAYKHGYNSLQALIVSNVKEPLPCDENSVVNVDKVLLSDKKLEKMDRYKDFDYRLFRHIEERLHPWDTYMK